VSKYGYGAVVELVIEERLFHMLFCTKNPIWSTLGSNLGVLVQHSATCRLR